MDIIFNTDLNRLQLLSQQINENNKIIKIAVHRNHSFEMVSSVLNAFLNFSNLKAEFLYSDYDDSLNYSDIAKDADINLIWLDETRYNNIDFKEWIIERILSLKNISSSKIILYTTGENDLSDISIPDVIVANSNNIKSLLNDKYLDLKNQEYSATRYSNKTCLFIARELGLIYIPAMLLPNIKAIVLDLDNTLYDGVLGEDKISNIKPFLELQKYLKVLKEKGIFLAIVSKNNYEDVEKLFRKRDDFPLKIYDFANIQANWNSKADNIAHVAQKLNIGIESMLFIDDNIGEIEDVKLHFNRIKTIIAISEEFSINSLKFYPGLYKTILSNEDKIRTRDIQANSERENLKNNFSEDEYFKKLEISLAYNLDPKENLQRITELLNKTNQFIFNYARYTQTEINEIYNNNNYSIITVSMKDKLSDSGIIGIIIAHKSGTISIIDELTISCRALGRNIESLLISKLFEFTNEKLSTTQICLYYKTGEKNNPAINWLEKFSGEKIINKQGKIMINNNKSYDNRYVIINKLRGLNTDG